MREARAEFARAKFEATQDKGASYESQNFDISAIGLPNIN